MNDYQTHLYIQGKRNSCFYFKHLMSYITRITLEDNDSVVVYSLFVVTPIWCRWFVLGVFYANQISMCHDPLLN